MRDLKNNIDARIAIAPVVVADNTAQTSGWIDRLGFSSLAFIIATGTLADADAVFSVLVEDADADNQSDVGAVDDENLIGTEADAGFTFAADNSTRTIGYVGDKRYVRIKITPSGNGGNAALAAVALLGHPNSAPVG